MNEANDENIGMEYEFQSEQDEHEQKSLDQITQNILLTRVKVSYLFVRVELKLQRFVHTSPANQYLTQLVHYFLILKITYVIPTYYTVTKEKVPLFL